VPDAPVALGSRRGFAGGDHGATWWVALPNEPTTIPVERGATVADLLAWGDRGDDAATGQPRQDRQDEAATDGRTDEKASTTAMIGRRHDDGSKDPDAPKEEAKRLRDLEHELSERLAELRELGADLDARITDMARSLRQLGIQLRSIEHERDRVDAERRKLLEDVAYFRQRRDELDEHRDGPS